MNNLYGLAMCQDLPTGGFGWLSSKDLETFDVTKISQKSKTGYILECDLEYPAEIHDAHNEYPLAPEKIKIPVQQLGSYQKNLINSLNLNYIADQQKLIPHIPSTR